MELSQIRKKESKLTETTLLLILTTLCVISLNFYYYDLINHKTQKVKTTAQILNVYMERMTKE
jgi:hypothetical protein